MPMIGHLAAWRPFRTGVIVSSGLMHRKSAHVLFGQALFKTGNEGKRFTTDKNNQSRDATMAANFSNMNIDSSAIAPSIAERSTSIVREK